MLKYLSVLKNVLLKPEKIPEKPPYIQLEPTTYCNLRCQMCLRQFHPVEQKHMGLEDFKKIMDLIEPKKIAMSGEGEPFLNPEVTDMFAYAKSKGASVLTTSNFSTVEKELAEKIVESGIDLIKVSIDASTPETYKTIRGMDCFDKVLESIDLVNRVKRKKDKNTPEFRFQYVLQKENIEEIGRLFHIAHEHHVSVINFQLLGAPQNKEEVMALWGEMTKDKLGKTLENARQLEKKTGVVSNATYLVRRLDRYWDHMMSSDPHEEFKYKCNIIWFSANIRVDGTLNPCCSFSSTNADMGNILEQPWEEVWNSEKFRSFRRTLKEGKRPCEECVNCVPSTMRELFAGTRYLPQFL
ncbi:radical SAM/SPASM domain-containing protein [Candidatus Altiarchaeota archaeon]